MLGKILILSRWNRVIWIRNSLSLVLYLFQNKLNVSKLYYTKTKLSKTHQKKKSRVYMKFITIEKNKKGVGEKNI